MVLTLLRSDCAALLLTLGVFELVAINADFWELVERHLSHVPCVQPGLEVEDVWVVEPCDIAYT